MDEIYLEGNVEFLSYYFGLEGARIFEEISFFCGVIGLFYLFVFGLMIDIDIMWPVILDLYINKLPSVLKIICKFILFPFIAIEWIVSIILSCCCCCFPIFALIAYIGGPGVGIVMIGL